MTNFDLHERAQQLADTASAYELARRLAEAEQDRDQLRGCFHSACEELTALKAALVDEGEEVPTGPALSLVEALKGKRDDLAATLDKICNIFGIGEAARSSSVLLVNVENAARFADYLRAIEHEFLMVPGEPDDDYPDEEAAPECLVNSWGAKSREDYVEQFRSALARLDASAWSGWCCQYPGKMPRLYGSREIAELNHDPDNGDRLFQVAELRRQVEEGCS